MADSGKATSRDRGWLETEWQEGDVREGGIPDRREGAAFTTPGPKNRAGQESEHP